MSPHRWFVIALVLSGTTLLPAQQPEAEAPNPNPTRTTIRPAEEAQRINQLRRSANRNIESSRWRLAIKDVKELIVMRPFESDYQLTLGLLFHKAGNLQEARRKYQDYMDLGGEKAVGHLMIAETFAAARGKVNKEQLFFHLRKSAENGMNLMKGVEAFDSLRHYRGDTEFIKLALQLERYQIDFDEGAVADPMTSRFRREVLEDEVDPNALTNIWPEPKQRQHVLDAQNQLSKIEWALGMQDENKAMAAYETLVSLCEQIHRISDPALKSGMRKIIAEREEIESRIEEIRLKFLYGRAQGLIDDMRNAFRNEDYPKVKALLSEVKRQADSMLTINEEFQEVSTKIMEVANEWVRKAEIRREFSAKVLTIQGIVYENDVRYAIVNDHTLAVGEQFEDMRVVKIEPNRVLFRYKGENVPLIFRRY